MYAHVVTLQAANVPALLARKKLLAWFVANLKEFQQRV
jgi:hypothetical protein